MIIQKNIMSKTNQLNLEVRKIYGLYYGHGLRLACICQIDYDMAFRIMAAKSELLLHLFFM